MGAGSFQFDVDEALEHLVIPTLFAGARPTAEPRFVLVAGPRGSGATRAIGALVSEASDGIAVISAGALSSFHSEADESAPDAQERVAEAAATWLTQCLRHAREERLPLLLAGQFPDVEAVIGIERLFHEDGFRTEVAVVATSPAENALTLASLYAHQLHAGTRNATLDESDADHDFAHTLSVLRALETATGVDRITVRNRDGEHAFDGTAAENSLRGAAAAFEDAARAPMTTLRAVQWLSELKRVTRFSRTLHPAPADLTSLLVELHGRAIREIVPTLAVPAGSKVTRALDARLAEDLVRLRESLPARRPEAATGPAVTPGTPDTRGPSR
ncbi:MULTISPECIES: zeta toxin family protein [Microbacterium]|uniref:zeta toxin family protein n=1 Tax=Microbacterium TaxID=33882 RepID=UPI00146E4E7B|nr:MULTISPECIES: zeta toxin family protein [Microbacterium]